jgi:hypothetical protein
MTKPKKKVKENFTLTIECSDKNVLENLKCWLDNDAEQQLLILDDVFGEVCFYPEIKQKSKSVYKINCDYKTKAD